MAAGRRLRSSGMGSNAAELSSIRDAIDDIERRLAGMARGYEGTEHEDVLAVLYEAERSLRAGRRHVERAEGLTR